ncbi:MAG TPA: hypothetical protein VLA80_01395 [Actinomycetota bacterium]|nr:hypothetical protein [Actinomycetota bacterium]
MTGPADPLPQEAGAVGTSAEIEGVLAGLDETDLAAHADAFEAVNDAILAELRRLEAL